MLADSHCTSTGMRDKWNLRERGFVMTDTPNNKVTIKSIAEEMGISFSTVSKALNGDPRVKKETLERVLKKAIEMNYTPNQLARGLRSKETKTIAMILNDLDNQVHTMIVKQVSIALAAYGYTTLVCDSQFNEELERQNIIGVLSRMPAALIISPVGPGLDNLLLLSGMLEKTIVLDYVSEQLATNYVHLNHTRSGFLSAEAMLRVGHRRNLVLAGPAAFPASSSYIDGIRQAYAHYEVPFAEASLMHCIPSIEAGYEAVMAHAQAQQLPFTGVIAFCDTLAYGVFKAAAKLQLHVPTDLSVIGYDDNPIAAFSSPPLTSIHVPRERIAQHCANILIEKVTGNYKRLCSYSLETTLSERASIHPLS